MNIPATPTQSTPAFPRRFGRYDAVYLEARTLGKPLAVVMRQAGYSAGAIKSAQRQGTRIRARLADLLNDEARWGAEKRQLYLGLRQEAYARLRTRRSKDLSCDVKLIEQLDALLRGLAAQSAAANRVAGDAAKAALPRPPDVPEGVDL
ncbi:MAG: hypothetical protein ACR2OZ_07035 [Verrucomicrobiales bacterium]